jgi:hypothetical protein
MMFTKDQLLKQKENILIEIDYHSILDFCGRFPEKAFLGYKSVRELRDELSETIDMFIDMLGNITNKPPEDLWDMDMYLNNKWWVDFSPGEEEPMMRVCFRYEVTEVEGGE